MNFALLGVIILHGFNFKEFVPITFKFRMVFDVSAQVSDLDTLLRYSVGRDSSVGIATCYRLSGPGI